MRKIFKSVNVKTRGIWPMITWKAYTKIDLNEWVCGVDSSGSGWEPMADFWTYGNEPSGSITWDIELFDILATIGEDICLVIIQLTSSKSTVSTEIRTEHFPNTRRERYLSVHPLDSPVPSDQLVTYSRREPKPAFPHWGFLHIKLQSNEAGYFTKPGTLLGSCLRRDWTHPQLHLQSPTLRPTFSLKSNPVCVLLDKASGCSSRACWLDRRLREALLLNRAVTTDWWGFTLKQLCDKNEPLAVA
jgi:hypothetical protein